MRTSSRRLPRCVPCSRASRRRECSATLTCRRSARATSFAQATCPVRSSWCRPATSGRAGPAFFMVYPQLGDAIDGELRGPDRVAEATRALMDEGRRRHQGRRQREGRACELPIHASRSSRKWRCVPPSTRRRRKAFSLRHTPTRAKARRCGPCRRAQHRARHVGGR